MREIAALVDSAKETCALADPRAQSATELAPPVLRHEDPHPTDTQAQLAGTFADLLSRHCPPERVREVCRGPEPHTDEHLWQHLVDWGVTELATWCNLADLVLLAEQVGARLAPIPFVDYLSAIRLLNSAAREVDAAYLSGDAVACLALEPFDHVPQQLISSGAIASGVVGILSGRVVLLRDGCVERPRNLADLPLGRWSVEDAAVDIVDDSESAGPAWTGAVLDWMLLTAAELTGLADGANTVAIEYAKIRTSFGVPIGGYQALSHPMVDQSVAVVAVRNLVRRAAWHVDHREAAAEALVRMAYQQARRVASASARLCVHVLGGIGVTLESDAHLYLTKAKALTLLGGDPSITLDRIAELIVEVDSRPTPPLWVAS